MDGSSEISGLLSNVQDIDALTDHVIDVVRNKIREQTAIRVKEIVHMLTLVRERCFIQDLNAFVRPFVELFMDSTNAPRMYTVNKLLKKIVEFHQPLAK